MNNILKKINASKHIVVVAHINPDADTLGSASAIYTYILQLHKKVSFFCASKDIESKLKFIPWVDKIRFSFPNSADLAIVCDCASLSRVGVKVECDIINIDHHRSNNNYGLINLIEPNYISTTQIVYQLFSDNNIKINKKVATALYAGLLDDSDGFMSEKVDSAFFAIITQLIESGADYRACNKYLQHYISLAELRLKSLMFSNMQLFNDGQVVFFNVSDDDMKITGASLRECEGALEEGLYLPTAKVSFLLFEKSDLSIKGSLRSNSNFDVMLIAKEFNGGGHKTRAGFNIEKAESLEKIKNKILTIIDKEIKNG